jgi:hypothetical protein
MTDRPPLTAAQIELIQQKWDERNAAILADLDAKLQASLEPLRQQVTALTTQVATMQEALAQLDVASVKVGDRVGLRAAMGQLLSAADGGPTIEHETFEFESRGSQGDWESFTVERS